MNIYRLLVLLCLFINYSAALANSVNIGFADKANPFSPLEFYNSDFVKTGDRLTGYETSRESKIARQTHYPEYNLIDSTPKTNDVTFVIPFGYKQSGLSYSFTLSVLDSVIDILLKNELLTLSIDGYSYFDEGNDNICYWLSFNRALAVKYYVLGRGVDSSRVIELKARSKIRSIQRNAKKEPVNFNCTAEIIVNYPIPSPVVELPDQDEDGIADNEDSCINEYGDKAHQGCPNKAAVIIPFKPQQSALFSTTFNVLDSVVEILRNDPCITVSIEGHAYKNEGVETVCDRLANERADIVRRYLLTRHITPSRIDSIKGFGNLRPLNAGRNSWEITRNSRAEIFLGIH